MCLFISLFSIISSPVSAGCLLSSLTQLQAATMSEISLTTYSFLPLSFLDCGHGKGVPPVLLTLELVANDWGSSVGINIYIVILASRPWPQSFATKSYEMSLPLWYCICMTLHSPTLVCIQPISIYEIT